MKVKKAHQKQILNAIKSGGGGGENKGRKSLVNSISEYLNSDPKGLQGCAPNDPFKVSRFPLIKAIANTCLQGSKVLIRAPPLMGKTVFLQDFIKYIFGLYEFKTEDGFKIFEDYDIILITASLHDTKDLLDNLITKVSPMLGTGRKKLVIIDDSQFFYSDQKRMDPFDDAKQRFWSMFKEAKIQTSILAACTYGVGSGFPSSPSDVFPQEFKRSYMDLGLNYTRAEDLCKAICSANQVDYQPQIFEIIGRLTKLVKKEEKDWKDKGDEEEEDEEEEDEEEEKENSTMDIESGDQEFTTELSTDDQFHVGLFRNGLQEGILSLLAGPEKKFSLVSFANYCMPPAVTKYRWVTRAYTTTDQSIRNHKEFLRGLFTESEVTGENEQILDLERACVITERAQNTYVFVTLLARFVFFNAVYPTNVNPLAKIASLESLCFTAISGFDVTRLRQARLSTKTGRLATETCIQQLFSTNLFALIPPKVVACGEMAKFVPRGRIDFYIGSWDNKFGNYGIETLRKGSKRKDHITRLLKGGKYFCYEIKESVILDFRYNLKKLPKGFKNKKISNKKYGKYYICSFAEDFASITISGEGVSISFTLGQNLTQPMLVDG